MWKCPLHVPGQTKSRFRWNICYWMGGRYRHRESKMAHILLIHKSPQGWTIMLSLVAYIFFARKTMISYLHWLCDIYRLLLIFWLQNSFFPKFHTGFMKLYSSPFNSMIVFSYCSWPFTTFNLYSCPFLNSSFFLKVWLSVSTIYRQIFALTWAPLET